MHGVVKAERETLDFLVAGQPQLVADVMADGFAVIVLHHGEEAAQHTGAEQQ